MKPSRILYGLFIFTLVLIAGYIKIAGDSHLNSYYANDAEIKELKRQYNELRQSKDSTIMTLN